ncbi:MAG: hypothetical protein US11_C0002G0016 [Candidatus Roizmanbacteria bacterium GW2011_GWA2_36_23]|uniref:Glycosyltransferase RgtA/B/C/D-like domain-containing protein n=1 Tax=Candidatus Roizmanbacteria bacterium GW2011_GWA2_36_23 TaxID=1618480 RepID=A0A0G0E8W2_9BACT|nr:MAG: hypothetical protein US11_C0002G0016 [Candidatus Roizmanbacteria bacterium GW2011_GWA2_36_23]
MIKQLIYIVPIILLLIFSIILIFFRFTDIPGNLAFDEVEFAKLALSLDGKTYIPYSPLATGHSTLYFYFILLSFKIIGINIFALRLPSAIFGILSIIVFYYIMKTVFKKLNILMPFLLALVFLSSRWFFNFARFSFEATLLIFLELMSLYFLISWLNNPKGYIKLIFVGIFAGLAYNSYTPGRIFFLVPLFAIIYSFIHKSKNFRNFINLINYKTVISFIIPFIIIIAPLAVYLTQNPDNRFDKQFFLKNTEMKASEKIGYLISNISSTALMFNFKGDLNGRHNYPGKSALNPLMGLFFLAGFIIAIIKRNEIINRIFIFYFFIALLPAILTYPWENPNMLRTVSVVPSVVYFIGLTITNLGSVKLKLIRISKKIIFSLIVLLLISFCYEIRTYFLYQSNVFNEAFEIKQDLKTALKNNYEK